jgi:ferredoxin-NADP reductase
MTPRVVSVMLKADLPRSVAGQHLDLRLTAPDGYQAQRSYSLASAPGSALWELAIERLDEGEVSPYFHEVAQPGDRLEVRGPLGGHFIWRAQDGGPLLLIGGGAGLVPLMAMLREAQISSPALPVFLIASVRAWPELLFRDELLAAQAQPELVSGGLRLVVTTTRGPRQRAQDHERRLDAGVLRELLGAWPHVPRQAYVCGATRFVESVAAGLVEAGIAPDRIRTERYGGA